MQDKTWQRQYSSVHDDGPLCGRLLFQWHFLAQFYYQLFFGRNTQIGRLGVAYRYSGKYCPESPILTEPPGCHSVKAGKLVPAEEVDS